MATNITPEDRKRASLEMANSDQKEKIISKEEILAKGREQARLAMEGERHRKRREFDRKVIEQKELLAKKLAEQKNRDEEEKKELTLKEAEQKRLREQEVRKREAERIDKIVASKEEMSRLKSSPNIELSSLRTLKSDLAKANKSGDLSLTKIMLKQQRQDSAEKSHQKKSSRIFLASIIFIIITITIIAGVFWWDSIPVETITTSSRKVTAPASILAAEPIGIDTGKYTPIYLSQAITGIINESSGQQPIKQIYFYRESGSLDFKEAANADYFELPNEFLGLITGEGMIGYSTVTGKYFFILKTLDRQNTWLYLLENENTVIGELFGAIRGSQTRAKILNAVFENYFIDNVDTRKGFADNATSLGIYGFVDQNYILFTEDEPTFLDIVSKYRQN